MVVHVQPGLLVTNPTHWHTWPTMARHAHGTWAWVHWPLCTVTATILISCNGLTLPTISSPSDWIRDVGPLNDYTIFIASSSPSNCTRRRAARSRRASAALRHAHQRSRAGVPVRHTDGTHSPRASLAPPLASPSFGSAERSIARSDGVALRVAVAPGLGCDGVRSGLGRWSGGKGTVRARAFRWQGYGQG